MRIANKMILNKRKIIKYLPLKNYINIYFFGFVNYDGYIFILLDNLY